MFDLPSLTWDCWLGHRGCKNLLQFSSLLSLGKPNPVCSNSGCWWSLKQKLQCASKFSDLHFSVWLLLSSPLYLQCFDIVAWTSGI